MECSRPKTLCVSELLPTHRNYADLRAILSRTYGEEGHVEAIRSGFEPTEGPTLEVSDFVIGGDDDDEGNVKASSHENEEARRWQQRDSAHESPLERSPSYGSLHEERVWSDAAGHKDDTS